MVFKAVNFIGKRWTILILLELYKGKSEWKRYSELKRKLMNITPKILSTRLNQLQREGLIKKKVETKTSPIKSKYRLTKKGRDFILIIKEIKKWSLNWNPKNKNCENLSCKDCCF